MSGPGPSRRATFLLPPLVEATTLLLAWPEIGLTAMAQTVHGSAGAALVLTRLSVYDNVVQATITGVARGVVAGRLR